MAGDNALTFITNTHAIDSPTCTYAHVLVWLCAFVLMCVCACVLVGLGFDAFFHRTMGMRSCSLTHEQNNQGQSIWSKVLYFLFAFLFTIFVVV